MSTPIRVSLKSASSELIGRVENGLGAVESSHKNYIDTGIRNTFADSLNLDEAFRESHPNDRRWDYLLGKGQGRQSILIALEPHSAQDHQVDVVIQKRARALEQLRPHLADGKKVLAWFWVASGKVQFARTERAVLRLAQNGIAFIGTRLREKDLPVAKERPSTSRRSTKRPVEAK